MQTLFTGRNRIELSESPSVNTHAMELLKTVNLPEGTLIFTHRQSAGRGQRGSKWVSESGKNLTLCVIFKPGFLPPDKSYLLSLTVSLSLADLVAEILGKSAEVKLKWPNDLYVNGLKMAGILIENVWREDKIAYSVCGIGLNVNQVDFGPELYDKATSLNKEEAGSFDLETVMGKLMEKLEARYLQLRRGEIELMRKEYLEKLLFFEVERIYKLPDGTGFSGKISGIGQDGRLEITENSGNLKYFDLKEIIF